MTESTASAQDARKPWSTPRLEALPADLESIALRGGSGRDGNSDINKTRT